MKTTTIFNAYAISEWQTNPRRNRQRRKFEIALLSRIEEDDRARKALKQVEWIRSSFGVLYCPWCDGLHPQHAFDCSRQKALGLNK